VNRVVPVFNQQDLRIFGIGSDGVVPSGQRPTLETEAKWNVCRNPMILSQGTTGSNKTGGEDECDSSYVFHDDLLFERLSSMALECFLFRSLLRLDILHTHGQTHPNLRHSETHV
jgi:hypothetical protein